MQSFRLEVNAACGSSAITTPRSLLLGTSLTCSNLDRSVLTFSNSGRVDQLNKRKICKVQDH